MTTRVASAMEVADAVREARERGMSLRIVGAGTWLDAGHPVGTAGMLSLAGISGIARYTPDDLTMTVEAGTTLAELDEATRAHGQWCPLLPWGDDRGTVGATVATATSGPFAAALGRPRDLVLGVEAVDGTGRSIAAGGRVVKNVAGFDLTRAFIGSWGTLAVLTRLHLRLRARPTVDETWALAVDGHDDRDNHDDHDDHDDHDARAMPEPLRAYVRGPLAPLACERLEEGERGALGTGSGRWLVRIGGNASFSAAARIALRALGGTTPVDPASWDRLRAMRDPTASALSWKWDSLSRRLKTAFDPARVLNPGLLGDAA